jgi:5-methylcytosine-specific restriction protein A
MPVKPQKPCKTPGCSGLTREKFCANCLSAGRGKEQRPAWKDTLYGREWKGYTHRFIGDRKWCADPEKLHQLPAAAEVVDHIVPHRGDISLFWDSTNHQPLCKRCHGRKTATEDGGFGRARKVVSQK